MTLDTLLPSRAAADTNGDDSARPLSSVVDAIVDSILAEPKIRHLNRVLMPSRDVVIDCVKKLRQLAFPGYFGQPGLTSDNVTYRIGELVDGLSTQLYDQVRCCLRYREQIPGGELDGAACAKCNHGAAEILAQFFARIPAVRAMLADDVQAAFDSDPAAQNTDETIFCYPGLFAIFVQRMAHEFYKMNVPLLPRIMTEYAHSVTGIDMHPGAKLGRSFFIDHGTGVVIGETTEIGNNVKIYQGVTLGAVAPAFGQQLRGHKRHPTIEDDVVIYAGATILGGETRIGKGSVIGGNVFITSTVPPHNRVTTDPPKLKYRERRPRPKRTDEAALAESEVLLDFQI